MAERGFRMLFCSANGLMLEGCSESVPVSRVFYSITGIFHRVVHFLTSLLKRPLLFAG